jgi:putative redox protein
MFSKVTWTSQMNFVCENRGIISEYDTLSAPTPKEGVLNAMGACSGMDIVTIAEKMRVTMSDLKIEASAQKSATLPSYFSKVHMKYYITGDQEPEKFIKVVVFSMTKYCGVSYMISKVCPIDYEVYLNNKLIYEDQAKFELELIENG